MQVVSRTAYLCRILYFVQETIANFWTAKFKVGCTEFVLTNPHTGFIEYCKAESRSEGWKCFVHEVKVPTYYLQNDLINKKSHTYKDKKYFILNMGIQYRSVDCSNK